MFDPVEEKRQGGPEWDGSDIAEDVSGECSKYGQVLHCHADKDSRVGGYRNNGRHVVLQYA